MHVTLLALAIVVACAVCVRPTDAMEKKKKKNSGAEGAVSRQKVLRVIQTRTSSVGGTTGEHARPVRRTRNPT